MTREQAIEQIQTRCRIIRVWDAEMELMLEDAELECSQTVIMGASYGELFAAVEDPDFRDLLIMYYTGNVDRNGKRIFEGDIIEVGHPEWIAVVIQRSSKWLAVANTPYLPTVSLSNREVKIIGNIFQNPELMEEAL